MPEAKSRPVVFLGQSFGGILIKKALVMATAFPCCSQQHKWCHIPRLFALWFEIC